eukprot:TRINITY_DN511_c0_g1_i1.p1 TRINITY_DN511_c0_g1~~TRINITY_DN511_c0_g1_i1.p1  ORF type:complete len:119 (-),score=45.83 TRINITY_DN511_c0_g1_i1:79-435(-)
MTDQHQQHTEEFDDDGTIISKGERRVDILGDEPTTWIDKAPPVFLIFGALGSMIYGFRSSLRNDAIGSNRGQMGRVYFQLGAIVVLMGVGLYQGVWDEIREDFTKRYGYMWKKEERRD